MQHLSFKIFIILVQVVVVPFPLQQRQRRNVVVLRGIALAGARVVTTRFRNRFPFLRRRRDGCWILFSLWSQRRRLICTGRRQRWVTTRCDAEHEIYDYRYRRHRRTRSTAVVLFSAVAGLRRVDMGGAVGSAVAVAVAVAAAGRTCQYWVATRATTDGGGCAVVALDDSSFGDFVSLWSLAGIFWGSKMWN